MSFGLFSVHADTFGSGVNAFTIDFVDIGNAGNADDAGAGGGLYSTPYGGVPYVYRMGVTEVPQDWIPKATSLGMSNVVAGGWSGLQPAANMTWYEAAAFVNWLNTSTGHQAAYNMTFSGGTWRMTLWSAGDAWQLGGENLYRHKEAYYFLPSEDEWYKAAYHKNDGVTANYWDYPTANNSVPTWVVSGTGAGAAVYKFAISPAAVDNDGGLSAYGTRGQGGNVREWQESAFDGINDSQSEFRAIRGGIWSDPEAFLRSSARGLDGPSTSYSVVGFRVASIPEPSTAVLILSGLGVWMLKRRVSDPWR